jgi:hypothetical protein
MLTSEDHRQFDGTISEYEFSKKRELHVWSQCSSCNMHALTYTVQSQVHGECRGQTSKGHFKLHC